MTEPVQTPAPMAPPPCHATRWRIATIICLILLSIAAATGMSMMEQFKAHRLAAPAEKKLKAVPQVKYVWRAAG
jgi:nitrate/nitrite transporter NarK